MILVNGGWESKNKTKQIKWTNKAWVTYIWGIQGPILKVGLLNTGSPFSVTRYKIIKRSNRAL